jgi:hypothetical protein
MGAEKNLRPLKTDQVTLSGAPPRRKMRSKTQRRAIRTKRFLPDNQLRVEVTSSGQLVLTRWHSEARAKAPGALRLGPLDLFGCDRKQQFARVDPLGPLWLVRGGKVLELHRDRAILKSTGGTMQKRQRRPVESVA